MTVIHHPHVHLDALAAFVLGIFWILAIGVIGLLAFFLALGALDPGESTGLTVLLLVLVALWAVHAWAGARHAAAAARDPRLVHARERRGF